jgi:hypothetical protein
VEGAGAVEGRLSRAPAGRPKTGVGCAGGRGEGGGVRKAAAGPRGNPAGLGRGKGGAELGRETLAQNTGGGEGAR